MQNFLKIVVNKYGALGEQVFNALIILAVGWVLSNLISKLIVKFIEKSNKDEIVLEFFHTVLVVAFKIVVVLMALSQLGLNMTSLVAMFTAAAAAFALALKDSLSGIVDGIMILFAKPFSKGDLIEVNNVTGTIQEISLLYTYLLTLDNKKIVIPNSQLANTTIINYSSEDMRRVDLTFNVAYDSDVEKVKAVILEETLNHPMCIKDIDPFVRLTEYKDSAITFTLRAWTTNSDYETFKCDLLEILKDRFAKEHIHLPYPQMEVTLHDKN